MKLTAMFTILLMVVIISCDEDVFEWPEGIVYFQIGQTIDNDTEDEGELFDLNSDGFNDFRIKHDCSGEEHEIEFLADCDDEFHFPDGRVSMFLDIRFDGANQLAFLKRYETGDPINESLGIDGGCGHLVFKSDDFGGTELGEFTPGSGEAYIAMQIRNPDGFYHFGWLRVNIPADCSGIEVIDGAYELRQGKEILAGQVN